MTSWMVQLAPRGPKSDSRWQMTVGAFERHLAKFLPGKESDPPPVRRDEGSHGAFYP